MIAATLTAAAPTGLERFAHDALTSVVNLGIAAVSVAIVLCLWRLVRGPTLIDRAVAADTISFQVVGLVILLTVRLASIASFDAVLIVAMLGFGSTVAFAQFIGRRGSAI
jgi:multicomponent K+:H+ antiporter subunit F